jgi:hypothetical protein
VSYGFNHSAKTCQRDIVYFSSSKALFEVTETTGRGEDFAGYSGIFFVIAV